MIVVNMKFPSSSTVVFEIVLGLVTFDVLPEELYGPVRDYLIEVPSDIVFYQHIAEAGFETGYILISAFLTFVFLILMVLGQIGDLITVKFFRKCRCCRNRV